MNHLIKSWYAEANRLKKSILAAKKAGDFQSKSTYIRMQEIWLRCAKDLNRVDSFKFAIGDTVTAIEAGYTGKVTSRIECLTDDSTIIREYCVNEAFYFEKDLK
jgi:hypothetical protein